ncbi:BglG family transcription antiterminator [Breznakia pachnodae]|uniref:Transcriptional antiterminator n=1 Tax=Breznakia pachnodae TaxID=265178 RepID=A0ABU0E5U1_9FIRM|nr:BglG family transcription antiterminator [Breznakia pachnodae]MDQ0362259.1 transcriptional antiterminator [Breznakia pachnodae]
MNNRQEQLLDLLLNMEQYQTIKALSDTIQVSVSTVHNDLNVIAEMLENKQMQLHKKPSVGVKIIGSDVQKKDLLHGLTTQRKTSTIMSAEIRRMRIVAKLLYYRDGTSLNKLSEEFYVSKNSIVSDLSKIKQELNEHYGLNLIKDYKGTRISGSEKEIRHALSDVVNEFLKLDIEEKDLEENNSRLELSSYYRLQNIFEFDGLEEIEAIITEAEAQLGYKINDLSYMNLVTHIAILIKRLKAGSTYTVDESHIVYTLPDQKETLDIANHIAEKISNQFHIKIPSAEINYIYQYLVCSGIQSDYLHYNNYVDSIDQYYIDIVDEIIAFVSDSIHCDLHEDKELKLSLLVHVVPMMQRMKYKIQINNPLVNEIKSRYSALFSVITLAIEIMGDSWNAISDDEIGFLAIHFQAAIERSVEEKRVIIVCPEGIGFSRLIAQRIERYVSSVKVVDTIPYSSLKTKDLSDIDLVVSTVPILECSKPVVEVTSFISEFDIQGINNFLIENSMYEKEGEFKHLLEIIDDDNIFIEEKEISKEEVIHKMSQLMSDKGYVDKEFEESIYKREHIRSTEIGNMVAIPHGSEVYVKAPTIGITVLKHPMIWGKQKVKIIFLIAANLEDLAHTKSMLRDLYSLIDSQKHITLLKDVTTADEVIHIIETE